MWLHQIPRNKIKKKVSIIFLKNKILAIVLLGQLIIADIFFRQRISDVIIFSILFFYCLSCWFYKLSNRFTFTICFVITVVMGIDFMIRDISVSVEKASVWIVLFLLVGIIQQWREINKNNIHK